MLRERVGTAVDEMKAAGLLPERIVVTVKTLAGDAGVQWGGNKLFETLVNWCVERYYSSGEQLGRPSRSADNLER